MIKPTNVKCLSVIDTGYRYHNLRLNKKSSYLPMFTCYIGRYRYKQLPFRYVPAGDMFQTKIDKIFKELPNVFGIVDEILVENGDHDNTLQRVLLICRKVNLKLNKGTCNLVDFSFSLQVRAKC